MVAAMSVRVAVVLLALLVGPSPAGAREPIDELPCDDGAFADVTTIDCDVVESFLDADFAEVAGCELDRLRVSRRGDGFVVRARWRNCEDSTLVSDDGQPVPYRLRLRLEADAACGLLSGTLGGRGLREPVALMPVSAVEERCDALLDDGADDFDDEAVAASDAGSMPE